MYKSPIELIIGELKTQQEDEILRVVQEVGVNVDKDELLKALQYDSGQYEKGYKDGMKNGIKKFAERLKEKAIECDVSFGYGKECYTEVVTVIELDSLAKEMMEEY